MGRGATKAAGNVWYEARIAAAKWNERLSSREGAVGILGITPDVVNSVERNLHNWKLLKRTDFGIDRVCHYQGKNKCYNCYDRAKCNADIFERLAQYEDTEMPPETVAEYKKFEDELVRSGRSFQHILELLDAEKDGRLVILPTKEVYELTWDAGPDCDLICPVSIGGHGSCDMCEKGKVFAYKRTCKQNVQGRHQKRRGDRLSRSR